MANYNNDTAALLMISFIYYLIVSNARMTTTYIQFTNTDKIFVIHYISILITLILITYPFTSENKNLNTFFIILSHVALIINCIIIVKNNNLLSLPLLQNNIISYYIYFNSNTEIQVIELYSDTLVSITSIFTIIKILGNENNRFNYSFSAHALIASPYVVALILSVNHLILDAHLYSTSPAIFNPTYAPDTSSIIHWKVAIAWLLTPTAASLVTALYFSRSTKRHLKEIQETRTELQNTASRFRSKAMTLSHELCGSLASISATCQLLEHDRTRYDGDFLSETARIKRTVNRLAELSRCLLVDQLAQPESTNTSTETFSLYDLLSELAAEYGCTLTTPPDNAEISGDRHDLSTALSCIIENAQKYSPPGSEVKIQCKKLKTILNKKNNKNIINIYISDKGIGLHNEDINKIFNYKYRSRENFYKKGYGLGLHISKSTIDDFGGEISVFNNIKSPGCTFKVKLPLA
ncbi:MAG: HAMP domain-containing histidine kinase [Rhodospirillales bacterium]|nr:HAMP domain-containing histidine kinase [Rhodospirillales bacterium]